MTNDEGHVSHVEVELGEDDFGEGALHGRITPAIELLWIAEQFECGQEELAAGGELGRGIDQLSLDLCPLRCDGLELLLELGFWPAWFADEVEILFFFGVQFVQTGREPLLEGINAAQFTEYGVVELAADVGPEGVAEPYRDVVLFDGFLNVLDFEVGLIAGAGLSAPAEEVEVGAAVAFSRCDDEPFAAAAAPDESLKPVVVMALPGAASAAQGEDALHPVKQFGCDERLVASGVFLPVVGDVAEVVAVAEDFVERGESDGLGWCPAGTPAGEPGGGHVVEYLFAGVLAGAEQFKGLGDERCPVGVCGDGADFAAFGFGLADVAVAEFGLPDGAAVFDFLPHLVADVCTAGL